MTSPLGAAFLPRKLARRRQLEYAALLRDHISKEDDILYPLAERVIPETMRTGILQGYQTAETQVCPAFGERYQAIITQYEQE